MPINLNIKQKQIPRKKHYFTKIYMRKKQRHSSVILPLKKIESNFKSPHKEKPDPSRLHQKELPKNGKRNNSNLRKILQEGKEGNILQLIL